MIWCRESPEEFGASLWRLAGQCGDQEAHEKLFAADGGRWRWEIQAGYFSDATGVLDGYHASEHIWDAAKQVAADTKSWANSALGRTDAFLPEGQMGTSPGQARLRAPPRVWTTF